MQQFTVPQFIDVEDKIIGPITTRQFIIMLADCLIIAVFYKLFDFELFVLVGLLIFAIGGVFAFLKINGRPFHYFVLNFLETLKRPAVRIWTSLESNAPVFDSLPGISRPAGPAKPAPRRTFTRSHLARLSLIVDTHGSYREDEEESAIIESA